MSLSKAVDFKAYGVSLLYVYPCTVGAMELAIEKMSRLVRHVGTGSQSQGAHMVRRQCTLDPSLNLESSHMVSNFDSESDQKRFQLEPGILSLRRYNMVSEYMNDENVDAR